MARSALLSLLLLVLVTGRTHAQPGGEMIDGIIAVVGTEPVLYSELAGRLESGAATAGPEVCAGLEDLLFEQYAEVYNYPPQTPEDEAAWREFAAIGAEYGPFDLTLMPVGAYHPNWPDIHMNPEEAVRAHRDLSDDGLLTPIHWATFRLAPHPWAEPIERMLSAADARVTTAVPRPGQRVSAVDPIVAPRTDTWWRS